MKYTQEQIDRSLKKLAVAIADVNCPREKCAETDELRRQLFWDLFDQAWKVIKKTGHMKDYDARMDKLMRSQL